MTVQSSGPRLRLLLIEDDAPLRTSMARLLAQHFDVVTVGSADQALALLGGGDRFDALVTDLEMPECDGFKTIARIAAVDSRLAERAIIYTGAHMDDAERASYAAPRQIVISKDGRIADLIVAIEAQIAKYP